MLHLPGLVFLQEQSSNDETDLQMMRAHTETLLDTLREIAQVKSCTALTHLRTLKLQMPLFQIFCPRRFCQMESHHRRQTRTTLGLRC